MLGPDGPLWYHEREAEHIAVEEQQRGERLATPLAFCVLALTRPRTARSDRNASTSGAPTVRGCRAPVKRTKRRIQPTYVASVRQL
jgi:hypothetical protein